MKQKVFILTLIFMSIGQSISAQTFTEDNWRYSVISAVDLTVKVIGRTDGNAWPNTMTIPSEVVHNGITFTVTTIGGKATHYYYSYYRIDWHAGYNMSTLIIPSTITTIEDSAFWQCNNLANITFESPTPPVMGTDVFSGVPLYAFIHVPCGSTTIFSENTQLNQFSHFVEEGVYGAITLQQTVGGTIEITQEPTCSTPAIIEAIPATTYSFPAYDFVSWSDGDTNNPRTLYVTSDTVISAIFTPHQFYNIAEVFDSTQGYAVGDTAYYGDIASFTAIPYHGYQFSVWKAFNSSTNQWFSFSNENPYNRVMDYSLRLRAEFTTAQYSVTVHSDGGGNVWVNGYQGDNTGSANYMSYINIHATPHDGNRFVMWSDSNQFASRSLLMEGDTMLTAIFAPIASLRDTIYDTIYVHDTTVVLHTDTLWLHDTVIIHDTIYMNQEGIDGVESVNAKVYSSQGNIVVEDANSNTVTLYDATGRILATKQDYGTPLRFDILASGTYMIKIGNYPARKVVVIK